MQSEALDSKLQSLHPSPTQAPSMHYISWGKSMHRGELPLQRLLLKLLAPLIADAWIASLWLGLWCASKPLHASASTDFWKPCPRSSQNSGPLHETAGQGHIFWQSGRERRQPWPARKKKGCSNECNKILENSEKHSNSMSICLSFESKNSAATQEACFSLEEKCFQHFETKCIFQHDILQTYK